MKGSAYSPIDRLMETQVTRPRGTGAEYMAELSKKPGYKQAEAEDRDLQALLALPKMERDQFLKALKAKAPTIPREVMITGDEDTQVIPEEWPKRSIHPRETYHEDYALPGGTNYREILLQHPGARLLRARGDKGFKGVPAHFGGTPDILASIRAKDRRGPNYEKILHVEEIQSDWHQKGREHGYYKPEELEKNLAQAQKTLMAAPDLEALESDPNVSYEEHSKALNQYEKAKEEFDRLTALKQNGVPDAPYKKNWHELALKRMIQHAAENGYSHIAITPGAEQAKRYGLSQHVGMVSYNPEQQHFQAFKPNRETIHNERGASPERVKELIGKEAAERLMSAPAQMGHHYLEGEDLNVGGEGMKGFYDKMVPKFLNQFGKKYGAQIETRSLPLNNYKPTNRNTVFDQANYQDISHHATAQEAQEQARKRDVHDVHMFPITPQMREDVTKNGIPLYAEGGKVEVRPTVKDETIQRRIPEMETAAKALQAGVIDRKEYDRIVQKHKPVKPYDFVPQPASDEDADRALMINKKPHWRGHAHWPAGRKVGLRLDIPAYENHGVWVNSIHDEEGRENDKFKTSYAPVSSVKNATFDAGPEKAVKVATGEQNKSPFARIKGELHHMTEDEAVEHMKEHLNDPDYAQVGMDPRRHGFFYDRKTLKPVTHSAHVVQIGPLVLAHKPTYGKREAYAKGGVVSRETTKPIAHGIIKERVTVSPDRDAMQYELLSAKHFTKKVK